MSRLQVCFENLKQQKRKALVPYIVAGDPSIEDTLNYMKGMVSSGADIIELGVPFSDPMADGPTNQMGHERALKNNTSSRDVLKLVERFRQTDQLTPLVLMGYLNPIEIYGYEKFAKDASEAGVDALLIVDLPPEEADELKAALAQVDIDLIFLIAPTTTLARIKMISEYASGYLYYVSLKGVTGASLLDLDSIAQKIKEIKSCSNLPITVGFGIKDAVTATQVAKFSEGVVVGSVLVDQCPQDNASQKLNAIILSMRKAMDASVY